MQFIFQVRIKPGYTAEQYAQAWVRAGAIITEQAEFVDIEVIGEFEEAQWRVDPPPPP